MTSAHNFLRQRGWDVGAGGSYYLPGSHPHIHIQINTAGIEVADNSTGTREGIIEAYRVIWASGRLTMVALSRGATLPGNRNITHTVQQDNWEGVFRELESFQNICLENANGGAERERISNSIVTMRDELELMNVAGNRTM